MSDLKQFRFFNGLVNINEVEAISGLTSSNVTLTSLQQLKKIITLSGTLTANIDLVFLALPGEWVVINNTTGGFTVTAKTAAGTGVALQPRPRLRHMLMLL